MSTSTKERAAGEIGCIDAGSFFRDLRGGAGKISESAKTMKIQYIANLSISDWPGGVRLICRGPTSSLSRVAFAAGCVKRPTLGAPRVTPAHGPVEKTSR